MLSRHFPHYRGECRCEIKIYWIAFIIGVIVFIIELVGSYFSGSVALLSDAFHVFIDTTGHLLAILTAYAVVRAAHFEKRYRALSGLASSILLFIASIIIVNEAVERIFAPIIIKGDILMLFAVLGAIGNGLVLNLIHTRTDSNLTKSALMRHIIVDLSQSIIVIMTSLILLVRPNWFLLDPVLSLILVAFTFGLAIKTCLDARNLLKS